MQAELLKKLRKRDTKTQKYVFEQYAPRLLTVCRRYTPNHLDPLDSLHDGFIKIFEKINLFDIKKGTFDNWSKRIMINTALEKLKKKSYTSEFYLEHIVDWKDEFDIVQYLEAEDLMKVIETLPDGYKQVFNLYEIEGYSHREISNMLGIKEGSSRSNLTRAKQQLKKLLSNNKIEKSWVAI